MAFPLAWAGFDRHVPLALLARAAHRRRRAATGEADLIEGIRADLAEVEDISPRPRRPRRDGEVAELQARLAAPEAAH